MTEALSGRLTNVISSIVHPKLERMFSKLQLFTGILYQSTEICQ